MRIYRELKIVGLLDSKVRIQRDDDMLYISNDPAMDTREKRSEDSLEIRESIRDNF